VKVVIQLRRRRRVPGGHQQRLLEGFRLLLREHQSMVFSLAQRIVQDSFLAEEIAQDVFADLYGRLASFSSREDVVHWLRRVTVHRSIEQARRRPRRPQDRAAWNFTEAGVAEAAAQEGDPLPAEGLRQMIASLPIVPRTVVVLRYQEGLGLDEIAAVLEMPVRTVKSDLQRSLKVLRAKAQRKMLRATAQGKALPAE
jgi:RNA polymerase sigma-70 factor (ECF subfamily)